MKYTFGTICLDTGTRTGSTPRGPLHLTRKAFDLLVPLLESRSKAVTKAVIYDRVWPETFVAGSSLQTLVHEIRQAIDPPGTHESWIRTLRGVGYGFRGDVLEGDMGRRFDRIERIAAWFSLSLSRRRFQPSESEEYRATKGHGAASGGAPVALKSARTPIWLGHSPGRIGMFGSIARTSRTLCSRVSIDKGR